MKKPTHAVVSFGAHDMNCVGALGTVTVAQYHAAPEGPRDIDENNSVILDLWAGEGVIDDKSISLETAAALLGWPVEGFIQRGRQKARSEEHTSELQSLMRTSYAGFCL